MNKENAERDQRQDRRRDGETKQHSRTEMAADSSKVRTFSPLRPGEKWPPAKTQRREEKFRAIHQFSRYPNETANGD